MTDNAPKRPLSAFFLYCGKRRNELKTENPNLANYEIIKIMSDEWSALSDIEKKSYIEKAQADMQRYESEKKECYAKNIMKNCEENLEEKMKENEANINNSKKRPITPFFIYCGKRRKELKTENPNLDNHEIFKIMNDEWSALSDIEKKSYVDNAKADK